MVKKMLCLSFNTQYQIMKSRKLLITFLFFLIAMFLGWLLRLQFVYPTTFVKYKHLVHAHSHVILLGWVFNAVYIAITALYHPKGSPKYKKFRLLFWFIQTTIFLAMLGFLREGYALFSILFSTLFLFSSFLWVAWIWRTTYSDKSIGGRFIILSLLLLAFSSLGPLSLGGIMNTSLKETAAYPLSIYFYLHFLYNGFFIFGLIGVWFRYLDKKRILYNKQYAKHFFNAMAWSIIPLYALSAIWLDKNILINIVGGVAALVQLWGGYYLFKMIKEIKGDLLQKASTVRQFLLKIVLGVFGIKLILQLASSIQWVSDVSFSAKNFLIIGYIHLIMLGLISLFIIWYFLAKNWIVIKNRWSKMGIYIFTLGVFLSELILFTQGFLNIFMLGQIPAYFMLLLIVSGLMPLGILLLIGGSFLKSSN